MKQEAILYMGAQLYSSRNYDAAALGAPLGWQNSVYYPW